MTAAEWGCVAIAGLLAMFLWAKRKYQERGRVNRNRLWILSLDKAHLLVLLTQPDTGFDKQDCDGLVQLAFQSYPEGQKDAIVQRISEDLAWPEWKLDALSSADGAQANGSGDGDSRLDGEIP